MFCQTYSQVAIGHGLGGSDNVEVDVDVDGGTSGQVARLENASLLGSEDLGHANVLGGGLVSTAAEGPGGFPSDMAGDTDSRGGGNEEALEKHGDD